MITAFMGKSTQSRGRQLLTAILITLLAACSNKEPAQPPDHPQLTPNVSLRDITFHSTALNREMQYRVTLPSILPPEKKLPVVYVLHGGGAGFRDWSNYSDVARFAESGLLLVMPEGGTSYDTNALDPLQD